MPGTSSVATNRASAVTSTLKTTLMRTSCHDATDARNIPDVGRPRYRLALASVNIAAAEIPNALLFLSCGRVSGHSHKGMKTFRAGREEHRGVIDFGPR